MQAAVVHAADAWARINRRPSLSLVTGGPGHTNALTGVATAYLAGSPVVTVSGSRPSLQAQRGAFQDIDQMGMIRPVVKWAAEPSSATQIPFYVGRAFAEAMAGYEDVVRHFENSIWVAESEYHVGLCLRSLGRTDDAVTKFQYVIDTYPGNRWAGFAQEQLGQIQAERARSAAQAAQPH